MELVYRDLVGAIIEAKYDDKNEIMKWPLSVAPYECRNYSNA